MLNKWSKLINTVPDEEIGGNRGDGKLQKEKRIEREREKGERFI